MLSIFRAIPCLAMYPDCHFATLVSGNPEISARIDELANLGLAFETAEKNSALAISSSLKEEFNRRVQSLYEQLNHGKSLNFEIEDLMILISARAKSQQKKEVTTERKKQKLLAHENSKLWLSYPLEFKELNQWFQLAHMSFDDSGTLYLGSKKGEIATLEFPGESAPVLKQIYVAHPPKVIELPSLVWTNPFQGFVPISYGLALF